MDAKFASMGLPIKAKGGCFIHVDAGVPDGCGSHGRRTTGLAEQSNNGNIVGRARMRDGGTATEVASCTTSTCSFSYRKKLEGWNTSLSQRIIYALFPLSQLLTIAAISYWAVGSSCPAWIPVLIIILALACIPVDVLLFRNLKRVRDKARSELRMKTLTDQLETQRQYNLKMQQDMERIKAIHRTADRRISKSVKAAGRKREPA